MAGKPRKNPPAATNTEGATPAAAARPSTFGIARSRIATSVGHPKKEPIRSGLERIGEFAKGAGTSHEKSDDLHRRSRQRNYFFFADFFFAVFLAAFFFAGIGDHPLLATIVDYLDTLTRVMSIASAARRPPSAVGRRCAFGAPPAPHPRGSSCGRAPGSAPRGRTRHRSRRTHRGALAPR